MGVCVKDLPSKRFIIFKLNYMSLKFYNQFNKQIVYMQFNATLCGGMGD